jgi:hypothetical protein
MATSDALRTYKRSDFPKIEAGTRTFITDELTKLENALRTVREVLVLIDTTATPLGNYASDAAAAAGGVPLNGLYHNAGAVRMRIV